MRIFIEPTDVLLFRDGKPFSAGDDHLARSVFPPTPMPFQGAIRSLILAEHGFRFSREIRELIGDENGYGKLRTKGPFVAQRNNSITEFFPTPADLVIPKEADDGAKDKQTLLLRPVGSFWHTDAEFPLTPLWATDPRRCEAAGGFLREEEMVKYLLGQAPQAYSGDEFASTELRTGIRRKTDTHSVETGKLYSVSFTRLKTNSGFTMDIEGIPLKPQGILLLGGESRSARYETLPDRQWLKASESQIKDKVAKSTPLRFKLYLATPALFSKGWLPGSFDEKTLEGTLGGIKLKLKAAAINRSLPLGGWDMKKREPKPIRRAVPAGSVYFFEALDRTLKVDDLFRALHFQSISDEHREVGFGLTLIGGWNP